MHYILVNETHLNRKGHRKLELVKKILTRAGLEFTVLKTRKEGDAKEYTRKITSDGERNVIVAMGGDGTLHDVINGFADFDKCSLGLIPFVTGNDFAASAKIPKNVKKAAALIVNDSPRKMDFIELSSGLRSINSVGMGIDVDLLKHVYEHNKKGKGKYLRALIHSLKHFESCKFTVRYDGKEERHFGLIAAIGNAKYCGGGIKLFPEAEIDDGYLDLLIVDYISRPKILGAFIKLVLGKVHKVKKVTFVKTKAAEFLCESENYTIQAEGELYDNIPVNAHIVSGQLKFYLP